MLAVIICIIGLIVYFAARDNAKVAEVGRISFAFGLLVALLQFGGKSLY